jgi:hypothetical protein
MNTLEVLLKQAQLKAVVIEEIEEIGDKKTIDQLEDNMFSKKMKMIGEMNKNNNSNVNKKRM